MKISKKKSAIKLGQHKPRPTPTDQRKRFLALAVQIRHGVPLTNDHLVYLANAFEKIGMGESADAVFFLKRQKGQSVKNENHRQHMSLVFSYIAQLLASPSQHPEGEGLTLDEALEKASLFAQNLFCDQNPDSYTSEYLYRIWLDPSYAHMKTTFRSPFDPDSPFAYLPPENLPQIT